MEMAYQKSNNIVSCDGVVGANLGRGEVEEAAGVDCSEFKLEFVRGAVNEQLT